MKLGQQNYRARKSLANPDESRLATETGRSYLYGCGLDPRIPSPVMSDSESIPDAPTEENSENDLATIADDGRIDGELLCERPGDVIGPYTLIKEIGAGGFGVVYLA